MNSIETFVYISMIILIAIARFVVDKMIDTSSADVRFSMGMILTVIYTAFMMELVYCTYVNILTAGLGVEKFYRFIIVEIPCINFALLLIAIFYYLARKKHKISDMDKMKLKDL